MYRQSPSNTTGMPGGIPYIVGNELAERFSFYGMRSILFAYMTVYLCQADGNLDVFSDKEAEAWVHLFVGSAYLFPIIGGLISDAFLGKYRTILCLSLVYCLGHAILACMEWAGDTKILLLLGLVLIAVGSGGIKPCVSAHVGDQFGSSNRFLLPKVFGWFYLAINMGAFASGLLTPFLLDHLSLFRLVGRGENGGRNYFRSSLCLWVARGFNGLGHFVVLVGKKRVCTCSTSRIGLF
ncbi:MAG: hypothetical protein O3B07_03465 [Verrucomicrobia bacterium]|nr:hypothetical protein [Verrucomicrobiota bacterium]